MKENTDQATEFKKKIKHYTSKLMEYFYSNEPRKIYSLKCLVKMKEGKWTNLIPS